MKAIAFPGMAVIAVAALFSAFDSADAQLIDRVKAPNAAGEGIAKTLEQQVGADRGDWYTPQSSSFIIARDPFRAVRRGRQLFQRKFTLVEGQGLTDSRRPRRRRRQSRDRRGNDRQLRRMPRTAAWRGRCGRRRCHPTR